MTQHTDRGLFVALEGIDGSGTTTQAERLVETLNGATPDSAVLTCEPSAGIIGKQLRKVLAKEHALPQSSIALLFAADRLSHVETEIEPHIANGRHVVSDRYVTSSLAYQSVFDDVAWISAINEKAIEPALTIYLRISPEEAERRRLHRGEQAEIYEHLAMQREVATRYDELLMRDEGGGTWRSDANGRWYMTDKLLCAHGRSVRSAVIDAAQPIVRVQQQVTGVVAAAIVLSRKEREQTP